MARGDVYRTPRGGRGYLLDVQADLLSQLRTRVVVPLWPVETAGKVFSPDLNPVFEIDGAGYVMVTQAIGSIPTQELKAVIASLKDHQYEITQAIDILTVGF